ncbi:MAG: NAD-dependent epimerase/dehydratase family protein [Syntrophomonas sp.]
MKILVTGGAGFIGSHIVDALVLEGHDVSIIDNLHTGKIENINPAARFYKLDLCDPGLPQFLCSQAFHYVVHHAAQVNVRFSVDNPTGDARSNIIGTLNLLQGCRQSCVRGLLFASSGGAIYGEPVLLPVPESHSKGPLSPYGVSKLSVEYYLHSFSSMFGLPYIALRYGNVYGPRQDAEGESGVTAIFSKKLLFGQTPVIFGNGEQIRDYVYVKDVVKANLLALNSLKDHDPKARDYPELGDIDARAFNIGAGRGLSVNELFQHLKKITAYTGPVKHDAGRSGDLEKIYLDSSKARTILGWEASVDMAEGLHLTIESLRK